jgi:hypothetical protein
MAQLARDPDYIKRREAQEEARQAGIAANMQDARPVIEDLGAQGLSVQTIAELFNKKMSYEGAIPALLRWLPRISNPDVKEDIVRALSVSWARPSALEPLLSEFERAEEPGLRWAVANALAVVADDSAFPRIAQWVKDTKNGAAREMLAVALGNMGNPRALDLLVELTLDEDVAGHAAIGLGNLGDPRGRAALQDLLHHRKKWVRDEARTALNKLP